MADPNQQVSVASCTRRQWLRGGGALAASTIWPAVLAARSNGRTSPPARQAIVIYLQGGLSHYESFDPKPDAANDFRGEFAPMATSLPGVHFSEHMPHLSARVHKFSLVRSTYVDSPSHEHAIHKSLTGWEVPGSPRILAGELVRNELYPSIGSVVARASERPGLPGYVTIPHAGQLGSRVHYAGAGLLGLTYEPIDSGMPPDQADQPFAGPESLRLLAGLTDRRIRDRLTLSRSIRRDDLAQLELEGLDDYHRQAREILVGGEAARAFDLSAEPRSVRERYGRHLWGQQTVLARRLAERGVPFTLVNFTLNQVKGQDWDTHVNNFGLMKNTLLPPMDRAVSSLLDELSERGLLETTLVAMFGEFGRTPRINSNGGRDHWEKVFSVMLAGGGLKPGVVVGSSTRNGDLPADRPVHLNDVLATIYHQLGVSTDDVFHDALGRPFPILPHGKPIAELL